MNCHIKFSKKCPPSADTHACSRLRWSFTALSMAVSGNADQINESAFLNLRTVLASVSACDKTPSLLPKPIIQWIEAGWIGATNHWRWSQANLTCENSKLETIKTIKKINAILLNIKINRPKLVNRPTWGYKLATNWQNVTEIYLLSLSKNIAKKF